MFLEGFLSAASHRVLPRPVACPRPPRKATWLIFNHEPERHLAAVGPRSQQEVTRLCRSLLNDWAAYGFIPPTPACFLSLYISGIDGGIDGMHFRHFSLPIKGVGGEIHHQIPTFCQRLAVTFQEEQIQYIFYL